MSQHATTDPSAQAGAPSRGHADPTEARMPLAPAYGAAAVAGPALVLTSSLLWTAGLDEARLATQFIAAPLVAFGFVAVCIAIAERAPRAASALALLVILGFGAGGAGFAIDGLHEVVFDSPSLADEDGGLAGLVAPTLTGLFGPLAIIAIGATALRTRVLSVASGVMLVLAGVAFPLSRVGEIPPLAVAVDLLMAAVLVPIGIRIWRTGRVGA